MYPDSDHDLRIVDSILDLGIDLQFIIIDEPGTVQSRALSDLRQRHGERIISVKETGEFLSNFSNSLALCKGQYVAVIRSGVAFQPSLLPRMIEKAEEGYDVVIASRFTGEVGTRMKTDLRTKLIHIMVREMSAVRDPLSGMFLVRRDHISGVQVSTEVDTILPELILNNRNLKVAEVPAESEIVHRKKMSLSHFLRYSRSILKLSRYRILKFALVGASGVAVNEGFLYLDHHILGILLAFSSLIAIELSTVSNFTLNNLWTFSDRRNGNPVFRFLKYNVVGATGALVNFVVFLALVPFMYYLVGNLIGIGLGFIVNYFGSDLLVWRSRAPGMNSSE
ncbi:MAG: GtrA family protein [Thermoplasmataceae archaeon]